MCRTKQIQRSPSNVPSKKGCHTKEMCPKKEEVSLSISKCAPKKWQQKHRIFLSNVPKQKKLAKNRQRSISCVLKQKEKAQNKFLKSPFESAPRKNVKNVPKQSLKRARTGKKMPKKKSHPISPLIFSSDPQFQIFTLSFGTLRITENRGRNLDRGWDWGGLHG